MQVKSKIELILKYSGPIAASGLILNILALKSSILGLILSVIWLDWLILAVKSRFGDWVKSFFTIVAFLIIINSAVFYLFRLTTLAGIAVLALTTLIGILSTNKKNISSMPITHNWRLESIKIFWPVFGYLIFYALAWAMLLTNQSAEPIRTPWEAVPKYFFIIYFILTGILFFAVRNKKIDNLERVKIFLISLHFFLSLMIATLVYKIGFGFDPFVHRAAEAALAKLGYLSPKPWYYIGQYSLLVWWSKISLASIEWTDKLLVPFLSALCVPRIIYNFLKSHIISKNLSAALTILSLPIITPLFFCTVPQSLANLLFLTLIFFSLGNIINKQKIPGWQWLILAAIFFIHPLSALPAFVWLSFWTFGQSSIKNILKVFGGLVGATLVPASFLVLGVANQGFRVNINVNNLLATGQYLGDSIFNYLPFYSAYHLLYLYGANGLFLFLTMLILGIIYLSREKARLAGQYLFLLFLFLINLVLTSLINFQALIGYEQLEFVKRFLQIISLTLLPLFLLGLHVALRTLTKIKWGNGIIIFFASLVLVFSLYLSYPHNDALKKGRGFAASEYDVGAVRVIDREAGGKDYAVLANQSVAAASLREFGFKKYYNNLFYYPIPTSSPLYEIYLDIIYNGVTKEKIQKARELTGAKKIYLVINDYWLDAKKRVAEGKLLTDDFINIGDRVWVFGFIK